MNAADYYKANVGLVHSVSRKGYARLVAAKVGIDYEDVFQEMSVVFLKAYEHFDVSLGFQFSTFYFRSAYNRLNKWAGDMINERLKQGVMSVEELNGDDENSMEEVLYEDSETPEGVLCAKQMLETIDRRMSPLAKLILEWTLEPPPELADLYRKAHIKAEYGRSMGLDAKCFVQMSPRYVGRFISMVSDVSQARVRRALKEIDVLRRGSAWQEEEEE